ncbi:hypothetical protein [Enterobacter hormaechei]|uniref:hypothetical protein n=1 Tax=Enterobacter hormaechei TaxID=158836 RepID=UPI003F4419CE
MTLTKEWLLKTIAELEEERDATPGAVNEDAAMALAAMKLALASLEAEPVAWRYRTTDINGNHNPNWSFSEEASLLGLYQPLYTAPPAPVSVPLAIHDEDFEEALSVLNDTLDDCGDSERGLLLALDKVGIEVRSDARRAAMLQGADGNSPVIPDGWVMLPAEPTQAMMNAWLSEVANWRGHAAGYRAMIAAAPQQEVK